jgi:hypothetical protein
MSNFGAVCFVLVSVEHLEIQNQFMGIEVFIGIFVFVGLKSALIGNLIQFISPTICSKPSTTRGSK